MRQSGTVNPSLTLRSIGRVFVVRLTGVCTCSRTASQLGLSTHLASAWPIYDLLILVRALDNRNISTVQEHLDFGRIRASFTSQIVATYVRRTGVKITPRVQQLAALGFSIADPVVNKLISPEALSELLSEGWPIAVSDPPHPS